MSEIAWDSGEEKLHFFYFIFAFFFFVETENSDFFFFSILKLFWVKIAY